MFLFAVLLNATSFAKKIRIINIKHSKKAAYVEVNAGNKDGLALKDEVCFLYKKSNKNIACGKVYRSREEKSWVRIKKKYKNKIKKHHKDIKVTFEAKTEAIAIKPAPPTPIIKKEEKSIAIKAFYHLAPLTPVKFNALGNDASTLSANSITQWINNSTVNSSFIGFGALFEYKPWNMSTGFRFSLFSAAPSENDWDQTNKDLYTTTSISSYSLSFYGDYSFIKKWGITLGAGLDVDVNLLSFDTTLKPDEVSLYLLNSTLMTFSLRLPITYQYNFSDSLGLTFAINSMIPLYALSLGGDPTLPEEATNQKLSTATNGTIDEGEDLKISLDHSKNGYFALDVALGLSYAF